MPRKNIAKNPIAVLKLKLKKAIDDKNTILREFEDEEKPLLYHYRKYNETKISAIREDGKLILR
jgi:hypothetical protein